MSGTITTLSATYTVTTTDDYDNSVSTSIGVTHMSDYSGQKPTPEKEPVPEITPEIMSPPDLGILGDFIGVLVLGWALFNNGTVVGAADDPFLIPLGLAFIGS